MALNFSPEAGKHAYDTPKAAAAFLPYLYQLTRMTPGEDIVISCRKRTLSTIRLKLSYGRHFIKSSADDLSDNTADNYFYPYAALATNVLIVVPENFPNTLYIRPGEFFYQALGAFVPTPLFSFFAAADSWLSDNSPTSPQSFSRRWSPDLYGPFTTAIQTFADMRPTITATAISPQVTVLCK